MSAEQSREHWVVFGRWCGLPHTSGPLITWYHPFLHVRLQTLLQLGRGAEERAPAPDSHGLTGPVVRARPDTGLLQTDCVNMIIRRFSDILGQKAVKLTRNFDLFYGAYLLSFATQVFRFSYSG